MPPRSRATSKRRRRRPGSMRSRRTWRATRRARSRTSRRCSSSPARTAKAIRREAPPASSSSSPSRKAPSLQGVQFAVLALGDSTYEFFCEAGKILDRRLEELGATRLLDRRDCDVDYEDDAQQWLEQVFAKLQDDAVRRGAGCPRQRRRPCSARLQPAPAPRDRRGRAYGKSNPFAAEVTASIRITGRGSSKDTRHLELSLEGSGLSYRARRCARHRAAQPAGAW